jgi:hypothetical protein
MWSIFFVLVEMSNIYCPQTMISATFVVAKRYSLGDVMANRRQGLPGVLIEAPSSEQAEYHRS